MGLFDLAERYLSSLASQPWPDNPAVGAALGVPVMQPITARRRPARPSGPATTVPQVPTPGLDSAELDRRLNASASRAALRRRDAFAIPYLDNRIELFVKSFPGNRNDTKSPRSPSYVKGSAEFGNFLFGAEAAAGGLSLDEALNWGAKAQIIQDIGKRRMPTFSDRPEDIEPIKRGYRYYTEGHSK